MVFIAAAMWSVTYRSPDDARVALNPCLVAFADEGECADEAGGDELNCKNGVDLADELVSDVDGGFCDSTSELWLRKESASYL